MLQWERLNVKRKSEDISTGDPVEDGPSVEDIEVMAKYKNKIKDLKDRGVIDRIDDKKPVPVKDFKIYEEIKKYYPSFFEKDKKTANKSLEEIGQYIEDNTKDYKRNEKLEDDLPIDMPSFLDDAD